MIEELKKTKASKLWFSMVVVLALILNVSFVEAKSLKKGEEYKEKSGSGAIRVVSSDEVEINHGGADTFLGKYTIDGERVRVVIGVLGTTMVQYYKITPDGLVEEKDGTIYYSKAAIVARYTKLMWQQGEGGEMNWDTAIAYCKNLSLAGYNDWRLPNKEELESIVDKKYTPPINKTKFPDAHSSIYWSSTTYPGDTMYAWIVSFYDGVVSYLGKPLNFYARCVRDGQ